MHFNFNSISYRAIYVLETLNHYHFYLMHKFKPMLFIKQCDNVMSRSIQAHAAVEAQDEL